MGIVESVRQFILIIVAITCSWYGPNQTNGDPYTASYWRGELPEDAPPKVDYHYLGAASADRSIKFGTSVRLTVVGIPGWARGELDYLIGRSVVVTVVDRMGQAGNDFDLWPAAAQVLMGSGYRRIGIVYVKAIIGVRNGISENTRRLAL